tara:strand:+ start:26 stop:484 length:459 start_codon:yes stop_codon:yes gene_type:complete
MASSNDLSIEIYNKQFNKPKLIEVTDIDNNIDSTNINIDSTNINIVDSTNINSTNITIDNTNKLVKSKNKIYNALPLITCILIYIGVGVLCIYIAFQHNESEDGKSLKLTGNIVLVMYLGCAIILSLFVCLCGAIFISFCSCCCEICIIGQA